jgi:quinolinate synthase
MYSNKNDLGVVFQAYWKRSFMDNAWLYNRIEELKKERNAVIVAHYYQVGEVQDAADVVGDSFALAKYCASSDKDVIVFCGVHFMAESANILSPEKTVLLPVLDAGCPLADMADAGSLTEAKKRHPEAAVVSYINTTAEVKALSDICCTSSNAVKVIRSLKQKDIIFVPDSNLGRYVQEQVPEKNLILWKGFCITHHRVSAEDVEKAAGKLPGVKVLVHPECRSEVIERADFVGSTKQIIEYATNSPDDSFIIGTEMGVLHELRKRNPGKKFYLLSQGLLCPNMKKTALKDVYESLEHMRHRIVVESRTREKARLALERMLAVG